MSPTTKAAHTPGPWRLHDMERATIVAGKPGGEVANCCNGFGDQDSNARLIAAAPDLLAAAKDMLEWAEYETEYDGQTLTMCASCGKSDYYADHRPGCKVAEYRAAISRAEGRT